MKKSIIGFVVAVCLLPFCFSVAFANEGYPLQSREGLTDNILSLLSKNENIYVIDHDPSTGYVDYVSWISYDYLSELSVTWSGCGRLVYNPTMDAYFLVVSYVGTFTGDYISCAVGTVSGYVFGARANLSDSADTGILTSIRAVINSMYDHVANINYQFTREGGMFQLWMERFRIGLNLIQLEVKECGVWCELAIEHLKTLDVDLQILKLLVTGDDNDIGIYGRLDALIDAVNNISINVDGGTFNFDTLPITNKLDEVIESIEGISITTGDVTFDTLPIVSKLDEVIEAIDGISITAEGVSFDTLPIVAELQKILAELNYSGAAPTGVWRPSTLFDYVTEIDIKMSRIYSHLLNYDFTGSVDLQPVNDRIDAVVEEVQKISTFADLHEVVTVTPGVLGDVDVVTTGEWRYEGLTFYYEPSGASKTFSPDTNMGYWTFEGGAAISGGALDLSLYGSYGAVSVTLGSQTLYALNNQGSYGTPCDLTVTVYFNDGSSQEVSVFDLYADADRTVLIVAPDGTQITHAMCYFPSGSDNQEWYLDYGSDPFVFTLGNMVASPADSLSFTADGVPHTLYWSNEYEFSDGCYEGDFIFYDDGHWFKENVNSSGGAVPLYYYDAYLTDALTSAPTTTTTIEGETYTWFEWFYTSFKGSGGSLDVTPIVNKLKDIENALSNMGSNIDIENNTNININEGDENYNIFYVDDPDGGEDKSIVDLSGDTLKVFGKLLDFLYRVGFKGALDDAGGGLGDLSDFYLDTSEGSVDLWGS